MSDERESTTDARQATFATTHWSVVVAAGQADASTQALSALEKLCTSYWYPLYAFVRRQGHSPTDAEDLVQSFFARCLEKGWLAAADQEKGRFRSFLLLTLKRFLANEWRQARTLKRGGAFVLCSLDALTPEERYALEPADRMSADKLYERRWALTLLENVLRRLRAEQDSEAKRSAFEQLKPCLTQASRNTPYAELADRLGTSEGAIKVAVHRLRRRYREILDEEIARTVVSPDEIQEERRQLLAALS